MAKDDQPHPVPQPGEEEQTEMTELLLFQTKECYVYMPNSFIDILHHVLHTLALESVIRLSPYTPPNIPPRKSSASYRADDWNVNKWAWEGALRVVSKGEECMIKLEDRETGELYAQAFVRRGQQLPVEPVIDSSRYFALCIEENFGGRTRHAFIGIGFRERTEAYDFQAALYDHIKYLNKKEAAEEMEQQYQSRSSVDYSLKEGQTLKLQFKNPHRGAGTMKSLFSEQEFDDVSSGDSMGKKHSLSCLAPPPPPPPTALSPSASVPQSTKSSITVEPSAELPPSTMVHKLTESLTTNEGKEEEPASSITDEPSALLSPSTSLPGLPIPLTPNEGEKEQPSSKDAAKDQDNFEDDFGDFQKAE